MYFHCVGWTHVEKKNSYYICFYYPVLEYRKVFLIYSMLVHFIYHIIVCEDNVHIFHGFLGGSEDIDMIFELKSLRESKGFC